MDLCNRVVDVENLGDGKGEVVISIPDAARYNDEQDVDIEQDLSLAEIRDFKAERDLYTDVESAMMRSGVDTENSGIFWKGLLDQKAAKISSSNQCDIDEAGFGCKSSSTKEGAVKKFQKRSEENKAKDAEQSKFLRSFKSEDVVKERTNLNLSDVLKGNESLNKGLQTGDRLSSLKMPQGVVAFAQAAAKVNELPGWPLMSPPKSLMKKCEKCSREFCSTVNYRRHIRLHRRSLANDKDLRNERSQLASYWSKLSTAEASEVLSFKNLEIENLSGTSAVQALSSFIQQPSLVPFPHAYMKAGSVLLEIVQSKACVFPLPADKLLKVLDDASEGTFLCGGTSIAVQRFVYHGDVEKLGLEDKNVVASMSFLVEQTLLKAWMAERNVEALRCEKALVEEEEAAQRKRAKILEKKQQRRIRQKGQKEPDLVSANLDNEVGDGEVDNPMPGEEEDELLPSGSSSVVSSRHDFEDAGTEEANGYALLREDSVTALNAEPDDMENAASAEDVESLSEQQETGEALVGQNIGRAIKERKRSGYTNASTFRARREGLDSSYFRSRRNLTRGDSRRKLTGVYRGIVKGGSGRVVWTRKVSQPSRPKEDEHSDSVEAEAEKGSLLVGSLSVPLGEYSKPVSGSASSENPGSHIEAKQAVWSVVSTKLPPVKVWKAVVKAGDQNGTESARSATSDKSNSGGGDLEIERTFPPKLNVVVRRPSSDLEDNIACFVDSFGKSPSPTSELLANFLSERWATAVERNEALRHRKSKHAKVWPMNEQSAVIGEGGAVNRPRNFGTNSCGKTLGRWNRNSKEKHGEQRYMPRRQISTA